MPKFYKGFDKDLKCRGFQYEVGKEYREENADLCHTGFHACEYPLDVFFHYAPGAGSVYHEVELDEVTDQRKESDTKRCGKVIRVGAKLELAGLCKAGVDFILSKVDFFAAAATNTGDKSAATNTGDYSAATNTGNKSAATNTGDCSAATNTGDKSAATNAGDYSAAEVSGKASVAVASGISGRVKGAIGCALFAVERGEWDGETYPITSVASAIVDGEHIKADTWYTVKAGKFMEV